MGSSGGSNYQPAQGSPTPPNLTPFGQATDFNPNFINVLRPNQFTSALPADFAQQQARAAAAPPMAAPAAAMPMNEAAMRQMLARLMGPRPNTPIQQEALRYAMMPGAQGSYAGSYRGSGGGGSGSSGGGGNRGGYSSSRS